MEPRVRCALCHQPLDAAGATITPDDHLCDRCQSLSGEVRKLLRRRDTRRVLLEAAIGPTRKVGRGSS